MVYVFKVILYYFLMYRNKCIEIYELDPAHLLPASGLACRACLKNTGIKLGFLADNDMLLMVEEGVRGGI